MATSHDPCSGDVAARRTAAPRWSAISSSTVGQRLAEAGPVQSRPTVSLPRRWAGHGAAERASALKLRPRTLANSGEEIYDDNVIRSLSWHHVRPILN